MRFGERRKLRTFHADVGAAAVRLHTGAVAASARCAERCAQVGLSKPTCATMPSLKKVETRCSRAVEELVEDDEIERRQILTQRPTALTEIIRSTPSIFIAQTLAR